MAKSYAIFHDGYNDLGDRSEDAYTVDEMVAKTRADYMLRRQSWMFKYPHWSLSQLAQCLICGTNCQRVRTEIGGESWEDTCAIYAMEWARGTLGYAKVKEIV